MPEHTPRKNLAAARRLAKDQGNFSCAFLFWLFGQNPFCGPSFQFLPEKIAADIVWETAFEKDAKVTELHKIAVAAILQSVRKTRKARLALTPGVRNVAQGQEVWKQVFDRQQFDSLAAIRPTLDGGYITIGSSSGVNNKNKEAWGVKLSAQGQIIWERIFEHKGFDIGTPHDVQPTPDYGYLLVGEAYSRTTRTFRRLAAEN